MPPLDHDLVALDQVTDQLTTAMETVDGQQLRHQTPCDDWNLADLIDHVTGGNWFTIEVLGGRSADEALAATHQRFVTEHRSGPERAIDSAKAQRHAFAQPESLDRSWHHVRGELPGRQILRLRLHDLIVHAWDIDQTLDPPGAIPAGLVRWGLAELAEPDSMAAKATEPIAVDKPIVVDTTADPLTRYLALFGRRR